MYEIELPEFFFFGPNHDEKKMIEFYAWCEENLETLLCARPLFSKIRMASKADPEDYARFETETEAFKAALVPSQVKESEFEADHKMMILKTPGLKDGQPFVFFDIVREVPKIIVADEAEAVKTKLIWG